MERDLRSPALAAELRQQTVQLRASLEALGARAGLRLARAT